MNLKNKIMNLRPAIVNEDFYPEGTIKLQNDSDGRGDYIASWNHPTESRPTDEELA